MRYSVYTVSLLCIALSGCGTMSVSTYSALAGNSYMHDCGYSTSRNRPGDDECRYRNEPVPQPGSVRRVEVARPNDFQMTWKCRREDMKMDRECQAWKSGQPVLIPKY